jgi:hypothetical protein
LKIVTPRDFRNAYASVMKAELASFRAAVHFEAKSFAYFMRTDILPKVARHLGLLAWGKEYCTLDAIFYEERETQQVRANAMYARWISAAIEHERDARTTYREMNKLQLFNVPLKVLITYAAEGAEADSLLRSYEGIIRAADVFDDFATLRRQLVIFGTPGTAREWRFFAYESDGFVHMLPSRE